MDNLKFKMLSFYSRMLLGIFFILTIICFGYVIQEYTYDKMYIYYAGELRVISQRIAKNAGAVVMFGSEQSFSYLQQMTQEFEQTYTILVDGKRDDNGALVLPPSPEYIQQHELKTVNEFWQREKKNVTTLINAKHAIQSDYPIMDVVANTMNKIELSMLDILKQLEKKGTNDADMYAIGEQLYNANIILQNMNLVLTSDKETSALQKQMPKITENFIQRNTELMTRFKGTEIESSLIKIDDEFGIILNRLQDVLYTADLLYGSTLAYRSIYEDSISFLNAITELQQAYITASQKRNKILDLAYLFSFITLLLLLLQLYIIYKESKQLQSEINHLVRELEDLGTGNLTVVATAEEGITKSIAAAINYAIHALRKLVVTINNTAMRVSEASLEVKRISDEIAKASNKQAQEISRASESVNSLANSIDMVSGNAEQSAKVSQESVLIAHEGAVLVQRNIQGMNRIRKQILETEKIIIQLGESMVEVGETVSLIQDVSAQTNILAVNATIQAEEAGEAGRGFSVVADEIQKLAQRSSTATRNIEQLVKSIQHNADKASQSMQRSIAELVNGVSIAEDSDIALKKIENVSVGLSELIQNISSSAREQSIVSNNISKLMTVVEEIARDNAEGTLIASDSSNILVSLVDELYNTVEGFKIPKDYHEYHRIHHKISSAPKRESPSSKG